MFVFFYLLGYLLLALWLGVFLVQYIVTAFGGHIGTFLAFLVALFTGFNFLIPAAVVTWFLQVVHILH